MGLQAITSDGRKFAPNRDIVQLFPRVIGFHTAKRLVAKRFSPAIREYAKFSNLQDKDIAEAELALGKFVAMTVNYGMDDFQTLFVQSGLSRLPPAVLMTLMAVIGEVTCAVFYETVRSATRAHTNVPGADLLNSVVERAAHSLSAPSDRIREQRAAEVESAALPSILDNDPTQEG